MVHFIHGQPIFQDDAEMHYHDWKSLSQENYPHLHEFYELILVTSGTLYMDINENAFSLGTGSIVLIRPGDIHSKSGADSEHIELAFLPELVEEMFQYMKNEPLKEALLSCPAVSPVLLDPGVYRSVLQILTYISESLSAKYPPPGTKSGLRAALFIILSAYIFPLAVPDAGLPSPTFFPAGETIPNVLQQPQWLRHTISQWQTAEHRHEGLNFFCKTTGLSKEYICRTFKRCFGQTPTIYLNRRRLSYAVKRLLLSDDAITDIAYEAGFRSLSRFYHVFHDTYGITPRQLRSRHDSGSQP